MKTSAEKSAELERKNRRLKKNIKSLIKDFITLDDAVKEYQCLNCDNTGIDHLVLDSSDNSSTEVYCDECKLGKVLAENKKLKEQHNCPFCACKEISNEQ